MHLMLLLGHKFDVEIFNSTPNRCDLIFLCLTSDIFKLPKKAWLFGEASHTDVSNIAAILFLLFPDIVLSCHLNLQ